MVTSAPSKVLFAADPTVARQLYLIWQDPESRRFVRVGSLSELIDGRYIFEYTDEAHTSGFYPLTQFPDLDRTYVSTRLPAFFVNRLMSSKRESYPEYVRSLGIDSPELNTPMELLARTGGPRDTDTFHLVDTMLADSQGAVTSRFLASGVRHIDGAMDRLAHIVAGQRLILEASIDNPANARAQLICVASAQPVGYVPDWLLTDLDGLRSRSRQFEIVAERVSLDAHPHLRLLCRIEAHIDEF
ncbi:hypothetical protein EU244_002385 [Rhodococcus qingshengii]|jgi:hypothetical protein|uniref:hypothetical protein n=1 Tax=Rhodococcus qingshengii TaxID=334542 RepID=UPI000E46FE06|nr:hypothetical protein [Rhodococcus qingshengii]RGP47910.1 hypothetical protein AWH04_25115 [Rhodococcus erythropolis]THJ65340.1 hypothetical protein EU244_30070 [Rhodococcus qingshengii]